MQLRLTVVLILCSILSVFAATNESSDSAKYTLPEQTVTGSRTEVPWLENSSAITTLSKNDRPATRGMGIADELTLVPGLVAQTRWGTDDMRLSMRGIGVRSNTGERGVRILYDGIPESEPDGQTRLEGVEVDNLEHIEMLRGSGSSLYGNSAGGVLNLRSMESFDVGGVAFDVRGGSDGYSKLKVSAATGKNNHGESGLISFSDNRADGYREHSEFESQLINASWKVYTGEHSSLKALIYFVNAKAQLPGGLTKAQFDDDPSQASVQYDTLDVTRYTRKGRFGLDYRHDLSPSWDLEFTPYISPKKLDRARETGQFQMITRYVIGGLAQVGWRGNWGTKPTHLLFGIDQQLMDGPVSFYAADHGHRTDSLIVAEREREWQQGYFAQGDVDFSQKWSGTLGLRFEKVELAPKPLAGATFEEEEDEGKFDPAIIPRIGARYHINSGTAVFASVYGGYETPTMMEKESAEHFRHDNNIEKEVEAEPQTAYTEELGIRRVGNWNNFEALFEATFFHMNVDEYIVPAPEHGENLWVTIGETQHTGVELAARLARPGLGYLGLSISAGDFAIEKIEGTFLNVSPTDSVDLRQFKGKKIPGVSPNVLGMIARWEPRDEFYLELSARAMDKTYVDIANTEQADAWFVLNTAVGGHLPVNFITANWQVGISNLTDTKYASFIQVNESQGRYYEPGSPMAVFAGISVATH